MQDKLQSGIKRIFQVHESCRKEENMKKFLTILLMMTSLLLLGTVNVYANEQTESDAQQQGLFDDPGYEKYIQQQNEQLLRASISDTADGFIHNEKFADRTVHNGIDVSYYQGDIDWTAVKESGVEFVFIRIGYRGYGTGKLVTDPYAQKYLKGATEAGLKVGAYVFSQAITEEEGRQEADFIVKNLGGYTLDMPVVMDYEYDGTGEGRLATAGLSAEEATKIVNAFSTEAKALGYEPMVYANKSMLTSDLNAKDINCKVWLANYTYQTTYTGDYDFWQYRSDGSVGGISGYVDCDFWYEEAVQVKNGWVYENGNKYWYDNGVMAADKEVYDAETDAWYWFDSNGVMATGKDVFIPDNADRTQGKWVRYDENGGMIKGEDCQNGNWYRFDEKTGEMLKGWFTDAAGNRYYYNDITGCMEHGTVVIADVSYTFDAVTGILLDKVWYVIDGNEYWYEGGIRQGTQGRGKEIYDPKSDAWYWLDAIDGGKKATGKDVYQESNGGKWVRYDEDGHMVKGWDKLDGNTYYFDKITGAMLKGEAVIDDEEYVFDEITGILQ